MEIVKVIWGKYKYAIITFVFMVWITFFDSNSLLSLWKIKREAKNLQKETNFFKSEIEKAREQRDYLFSKNQLNLEKFAREKYLMKKENEDVFIIVESKD